MKNSNAFTVPGGCGFYLEAGSIAVRHAISTFFIFFEQLRLESTPSNSFLVLFQSVIFAIRGPFERHQKDNILLLFVCSTNLCGNNGRYQQGDVKV